MWLNMEKGAMDVLGPQHVKVIKSPNLNVSSSLSNYACPKEKEKKKDLKYGQRGVVPYGRTNKITQTLQKQAGCVSPSVQ